MIYDLLIIGSGPAGMGAAIYAVRAGLKAAVIDRSPVSGGQVQSTYEVDNYLGLPGLSGGDLSDRFRQHTDRLGVQFITADVCGIESGAGQQAVYTVHTDQSDFQARTIILATGASHSLLGVPGEKELMGMGVSYCATCDGAFYRNSTVAVVGGVSAKKSISCIGETGSGRQKACRKGCYLWRMWKCSGTVR